MRLAIFHTELSPYFVHCLRQLVTDYEVEILMYAWPPAQNAPFEFGSLASLGTIIARHDVTDRDLCVRVGDFAPDAILTCGWIDKGYTKACTQLRKTGIPVI